MGSTATVRLNSLLVSRSGFRGGRPCLRGTGITVHAVAAAHLLGLTAEEICLQNSDLDPSLFHAALDAGVPRVHLVDGRLPHALLLEIFTDGGAGTLVTRDGEGA